MPGRGEPRKAPDPRCGRGDSKGVSDSVGILEGATGRGASKLAFEDEEDLDKTGREPGPQTSQAAAGPRPPAEGGVGTGAWLGWGGSGCIVAGLGSGRTALCIAGCCEALGGYLLDEG